MAMSATSSVSTPGVVVTRMPRSRAWARSTASVPTPLTATISSFGRASIRARDAPFTPPVTTPRIDGPTSRSSCCGSAALCRRWTA